ncbi:uncharacterized protein N7479_009945 [Penicillium vulpinum]|uniref:VOC domain-containing protein n=1 Tax=Penicillium vulpinum TaxID=29845 RepID=A0A1V6RY36_9EURO|nr:uncharacterized protein N7479_009945 [Penicillium vulpinum]KAJ5951532.1 hypothetical protein N7479_009945 [Penicillium vulpinum]OQE06692.1 hypothetical protein PENVUL_c017G08402 [Penicillium vulpinum]
MVDFNASVQNVKSPSALAHVFLRTNNFTKMVDFYKEFLGGSAAFESDHICFISYDFEHHRIAIATIPDTTPKKANSCGLEHIAFTFDSLSDLALAYRQRKQLNMKPFWSVNHGPTTSIYYYDPDGNQIETQVDNFDTPEEATTYMLSEEFAVNPIGTDFDPEDLVARLESGESEASIKKRIDCGPRGTPDYILNPGK